MLRSFVKKLIPDKIYLSRVYRQIFHRKIDLKNPILFSEKMQWLKLYNRNKKYVTMVDKYFAKEYVSKLIGNDHIIPTIGVWEKFDQIDFHMLPDQFVLKCTHDSGGVFLCSDKEKIDLHDLRMKIENSLKTNYYWSCREWPYKYVKPRIIAEPYMKNNDDSDLIDYKLYCFNGVPRFCQVICNRSTNETIDFFDMSWVHQPFTGYGIPNKPHSLKEIDKPSNFELMKKYSSILSKDIPFVRIDFYDINSHLYFGEITFFPASGFGVFEPDEWNNILGNMIKL